MKIPVFLFLVSLGFLGCKESESGKNRQPPSDGKKASAPELTVKPMKMTAEQVDSTVRVRVISGGLPPMHYTGALLHSEELASPPFGGRQRHVLALLQGWTKARLKSPEGRVFVVRNRTDAEGDSGTQNIAANLLNLDERTGVATLEYKETPGSSMDVGYRVDLDAGSGLGTQAVTSWLTGPESRQANGNFSKPPLSVGPGAFESGDGKQGSIHFPANVPANRDRSPLAIAASGMLTGFFGESADDKSSFIPVGDFRSALNANTVRLRAVGIAVGTGDASSPGALPVWLLTENTSPALVPQSLVLRVSDPNPSRAVGDSSAKEPYAPIEAAHIVRLTRPISGPGIRQGTNALQPAAGSITTDRWLGRLDVPIVDGAESVYRLQLGWSAVPTVLEPSLFGPPFLVRFKREAGILSYTVEGLKRLSEIRSTDNNEEKRFILEAPVRDLKEIAGGREVLFQFDGAPYWKRFSLTRNEWLPLPPVDLTNVYLTGNANGLFILERGTAEVRRFALADLSQTASVKLPAEKEYIAILAGSNSESAPVHLVMKNDVLSLDPNSLQKRGFAISRRALLHLSGFNFSAKDQFEITGEGLSFWSGRKDNSPRHPLLSYLGDAVGLDNGFIRPQRPRRPEIWGTSVAEAYGINRQGVLATFASGNGEVIDTGALGPGGSCVQWLSPNSPVVFRLNHADRKGDGAIPATIGCFGYANSTPFAEVETPELSDSGMSVAVDQTGPKWVSFDPYTLRLGVLSTDRKTWVVHQVVPSRNLNQPVLLNWPDSTLAPGGEFRFKPVILGGGALAADLIGNKEATPVSTTDGTVSFRVAKNELASLLLLKLKLTSPGGGSFVSDPAACPWPTNGPRCTGERCPRPN